MSNGLVVSVKLKILKRVKSYSYQLRTIIRKEEYVDLVDMRLLCFKTIFLCWIMKSKIEID